MISVAVDEGIVTILEITGLTPHVFLVIIDVIYISTFGNKKKAVYPMAVVQQMRTAFVTLLGTSAAMANDIYLQNGDDPLKVRVLSDDGTEEIVEVTYDAATHLPASVRGKITIGRPKPPKQRYLRNNKFTKDQHQDLKHPGGVTPRGTTTCMITRNILGP